MRNQHIARMCSLGLLFTRWGRNALTNLSGTTAQANSVDGLADPDVDCSRLSRVPDAVSARRGPSYGLISTFLTLSLVGSASLQGCADPASPSPAADEKKDAAIGVDAEFGVETFALGTDPEIVVSAPANFATFNLAGPTVDVDFLFTTSNFAGVEAHCYLDGVLSGTFPTVDGKVTFVGVPKGSHTLACTLLDQTGQEFALESARGVRKVYVIASCAVDADCNDGNACSSEHCTQGKCSNTWGSTCCFSDFNCAVGSNCVNPNTAGAICSACLTAADCDDDESCTVDACDLSGAKGKCTHTQADPNCCSKAGAACSDGKPCTDDECNVATGTCIHNQPAGACCADSECVPDDLCLIGACIAFECRFTGNGAKPDCCSSEYNTDCDDKSVCTTDACSKPMAGGWTQCVHTKTNPDCCMPLVDLCDDGQSCTIDACQNNVCTHTVNKECCKNDAMCDDGSACTLDSCDEAAELCSHDKVPGCCVNAGDCEDFNYCTVESCNTVAQTCTSSLLYPGCCNVDVDCNDGKFCTQDVCINHQCLGVKLSGCCDAENANTACVDGNVCTVDSCDVPNNKCVHVDNGQEGCCNTAQDCDDADCATQDSCDGVGKCQHKVNPYACKGDSECDDGKPCTVDHCDIVVNGCGACQHDPDPVCCTSDIQCFGKDKVANPYTYMCHNNVCGVDNKCSFTQKPECCTSDTDALTICDDNNACTIEYCQNNECRHTTPPSGCCMNNAMCDDGVSCSVDTCNIIGGAAKGLCQYALPVGCAVCVPTNAASFADTNKCTVDSCVNGVPVHTPTPGCCLDKQDCNDDKPCTADTCNPVSNQCVYLDAVGGVAVCCNPNNEAIECASMNSDCAEGKCLQQPNGTLACQPVQKEACTVALSYCQDFEGTNDLPTMGWKPTDLSSNASSSWNTSTTGGLGPDRSAKFAWTTTKVNYDTCLQSPVFLGANASTITLQFDREFIPNDGETSIRILGSLEGTYADWTQATVIESFTTTSGIGAETVNLTLPPSLVSSNGLRLAFCVNGASTTYVNAYALDNVCVVKGSAPVITACPTNQIVPTGSKVIIPIKVKDPDAGNVITAQLIGAPSFVTVGSPNYFVGDKSWNTTIKIEPTVLTDVGEYQITLKVSDGYLYKTCQFSVAATYQGGVLIWKPLEVPAVMASSVKTALTGQGKFSQIVNDLALYPSLNNFTSVFVLLGNYPYNHILGESEVTSLKLYLAQGGKVYMEGGDTFMYDPKTSLHPFFQAKGVVDEAPNGVTGPLKGYAAFADNTANPPLHYGWNFSQDTTYNNFNDQIEPITAVPRTRTILRNDGVEKFTVQVGHDDKINNFRTIASSVPFAGVTAGTTQTSQMMTSILAFFANGFGTCVKNSDCDDGNSCTQDICDAGECVNNNVCICSSDTTLGCGDTATKLITNSGAATQAVSTYSCDPTNSYLGKEVAFKYQGNSSRPVTVTISNVKDPKTDVPDATPRLFVLKASAIGCDPESCLAAAGASNTVTFAAGKNQLYYFVVDVPAENGAAQFDIEISCGNGEDCTNAIDDNGNNLVDCSDLGSCCGDAACQKEICDGIDNTCNGVVDEGCDDDGDGWCDASMTVNGAPLVCSAGVGDCDDTNQFANPGMNELCGTPYDDDCDNAANEDGATGCQSFYRDVDLDGYGSGSPQCKCAAAAPYVAIKNLDCNDSNLAIHPEQPESCATIYDDNCDGDTNDANATDCKNFYTDVDADGYGILPLICQCVGSGLITADKLGDCVDTNANVNPGKTEKCNNLDDNCAGGADEGCDDDLDLYCDADMVYDSNAAPVLVCSKGPGDSVDTDPLINPEGQEICDNKDNNSNSQTDEGCDKDGDDYCDATIFTSGNPTVCPHGGNDCDDTPTGAGINPGVAENCDTSWDDNCNGTTNDQNAQNCTPFFFDADGDKWGTNSNKCLCVALNQYRAINPGDCNENEIAINPGVKEICDGIDNDCDKTTDEGCDVDGDGYCAATATIVGNPAVCLNGVNDCNDTDPNINPGIAEVCNNNKDDNCDGSQNSEDAIDSVPFYQDLDADGFGTPFTKKYCAPFGSYTATNQSDCDDSKKAVNPAAVEICDNLDNNCAGGADEGCDDDQDGQCDANMIYVGPVGICGNGKDDCNDNDASIFKGKSQEICDDKDDDCNGKTDNGCDDDKDGYCDAAYALSVPGPALCVHGGGDCDDFNSDQNPGQTELCGNGIDDDCDGDGSQNDIDAVGCTTFFFDGDNDTYGLASHRCLCVAAGSYKALQAGDCDDGTGCTGLSGAPLTACMAAAAAANPGATETCDTIDNNCNGTVDENGAGGCVERFYDGDNDGYGLTLKACTCAATAPYTASQSGDCDDTNIAMNPGQSEKCDNLDNNCDSKVDENCNKDGDQFCDKNLVVVGSPNVCPLGGGDCDDNDALASPGGTEVCDGKDNNCNVTATVDQADIAVTGAGNANALSNWLAQTFTPAATGALKSLSIKVYTDGTTACGGSGATACTNVVELYIYDKLPSTGNGAVQIGTKVTTSFQSAKSEAAGAARLVTFNVAASTAVNLTAGTQYAFVVHVVTPQGTPQALNPTGNTYAGGLAYFFNGGVVPVGAYAALGASDRDLNFATTMTVSGVTVDEGCNDDGDTYCDANIPTIGTPAICSAGGGDCNDTDGNINPGSPEVCGNTVDENCSGGYNDLNATNCVNYYADYDGDTYGKGGSSFQKVLINEIKYDTTAMSGATAKDAIELLITADLSASDIAGLYFGDSSSAGAAKFSAYHLNLGALGITSLKAGTIVVVGGKATIATQDTTYDPATNDWNLQLWTDGAYVTSDTSGGNLATDDIVWADTSFTGTTSIDSWVWGNATVRNGAFGTASKVIVNTAPSAGSPFIAFTSAITGKNISTNYATSATGTLGSANGNANTTFINALRAISLSGGSQCTCTAVAPFTATVGGDCDDGNELAAPNVAEMCDNVDNNCNTVADEGCDDDGDGYCDGTGGMITIKNALTGQWPTICPSGGGDCNDTGPAVTGTGYPIHPNANDTCAPPADLDCIAGIVPTSASGASCTNFYWDGDNDTYGVNVSKCLCAANGNYKATLNTDCDDTDATVNPGATEKCLTAKDDNCNGLTNDVGATNCTLFYADADKDGYGSNLAASQCQCMAEGSYVASAAGDCNDANNKVNPGQAEMCDAIDNNCNVAGSTVATPDITVSTTNNNDNSLANWTAQTFRAGQTGKLKTLTIRFHTTSTGSCAGSGATACTNVVDLFFYDRLPLASPVPNPIGAKVQATVQSATSQSAGTWTTVSFDVGTATTVNLVSGTTYAFVLHVVAPQGSPQFRNPNVNAYTNGSAYSTNSGTGTNPIGAYAAFGSGVSDRDVAFTTVVDVTSSGVTADEGCDDDADTFCDSSMYITSAATCAGSSKPAVGATKLGDDCNDTLNTIKPSAVLEAVCDDLDNNCDGATDDGCDADKDGYCNKTKTLVGTPTVCYNGTTLDCDDANSSVNPGKTEMCDGLDNNCNTTTDENCDKDNDDFCDSALSTVGNPAVCPNGGGDCNDTVATGANFNPNKVEICDNLDNNCTGGTDEVCKDLDGDGYCNGNVPPGTAACLSGGGDCDDGNINVNPGKTETCATSYDDNCNGLTNEVNATACNYWFVDADQDGYGSYPTVPVCQCQQSPAGAVPYYSANIGGDCDDNKSQVNPGATEICDGQDNNCQGPSAADQTISGATALTGTTYVGQTFQAGATGKLVSVRLTYNANTTASASDLFVYNTLAAGGPGTLLGKSAATVPTGANTVTYSIGTQVNVVSGTTYAIVVKVPASATIATTASSTYANGQMFTASALAGPYVSVSTKDLVLTTFVSNGSGVDEACDADGDLHCAAGKLVTSAAACTSNSPFPTGVNTAGGDDCNDAAAAVFKGAVESCDNLDNNCNGVMDENCDNDNDNYCSNTAIMAPSVLVATCTATPVAPASGTTYGNDCADGSPTVNPGAQEDCATAGVDDNCNTLTNELNALKAQNFYKDADGDGWGVAVDVQKWCAASGQYNSQTINDCDDNNAAIKGGGVVEVCDNKDNNCNGVTDEGCDDDNDDYCDNGLSKQGSLVVTTCASTAAAATVGDDCDDTSKNNKPGGLEMCDNQDNNCNGSSDENCDKDGDLYCDSNLVTVGNPTICIKGGGDCNDTPGAVGTSINPGKVEICGDAKDNNCNGNVDEGENVIAGVLTGSTGSALYFMDADQDGYPVNSSKRLCPTNLQGLLYTVAQSGSLLGGGVPTNASTADCNDNPLSGGADAFPGHVEWCDQVDNNCNFALDENCDKDGDQYCDSARVYKGAIGSVSACIKGGGDCNDLVAGGAGYNPGASETCDGADQNCNGIVDDNAAAWCTAAGGPLAGAKANSTVQCISSVCQVTACATGYANVNGTALPCNPAQAGCADGCECNTQDAFEPNNTCPGVQLNTQYDFGNYTGLPGWNGGQPPKSGTSQSIVGSIVAGNDHDWFYFYGQDIDDMGTNSQYDLYTVRAVLNGGVNNGAVMEVFRANSVGNLCPNLGGVQNYGGSSPGNVVAYQNQAGNNGNAITSVPSPSTTKPQWNTAVPNGYNVPGTGATGGSTPNGWNMVCCGDTDFWWFTSGNNYRAGPSNYYSEWGEWPCWSGDTYDTWDAQAVPGTSYTGPAYNGYEWMAQGWLWGATPGGANGGAHGPFPYGYDAHRCIDDSAWYSIHIYRPSGTNAANCSPYILEISNGMYANQYHNEQGKSFSIGPQPPVN